MNLAEIIELLETFPKDKIAEVGIGRPISWRGDYSQLAFIEAEGITVEEMINNARSAIGETFEGWKGGDFTMDLYTDCHLVDHPRNLGEPITTHFFKLNLI